MASEKTNSKEEWTEPSIISRSSDNIIKSVCHTCPDDNKDKERDEKKLILVSIICLLFIVAEVCGGVLSNSLAIASDAGHLLTDFGAFMVSLAAIWISSKPQTRTMSFGFHRAEVIGALISILLIWLITGILVYLAIDRIIHADYEIDAEVMLYVSGGAIVANVTMGLILIYNDRKNGEVTDLTKLEKDDSINIKTAVIHVLGDLLQSIGVLIASIIIYFKPSFKIIDPICTFIFSFIVLATTLNVMRNIFYVLMEGFPAHLNFSEVQKVLVSIPGVLKIHSMRLWSLTIDKVALSAHIVIHKGENQTHVLKNASQIICKKLNIHEVTLQIEELSDPDDVHS